jgi:hippurate hydrolase
VILIFQPAEEALAGGKAVCEDGILAQLGVEAVFGMHNWPGLKRGAVATTTGVIMAASNAFSLTITGRSCHASQPHRGADPIATGAQIVSSVAQIRSRLVDPTEPAVISIGAFHAGTKGNIIPDIAHISGTIRTVSSTTLQTIKQHLSLLSDGVAASLNCTATLQVSSGYPAVINTPTEASLVSQVAKSLFGADYTIPHFPVVLAGEDFSFYLQRFPGAFWFMGVGEDAAPLHNSHFDFCDDILPNVIAMHVGIVKRYCNV